MNAPTETVLSVVDGARTQGAGWIAKCPAHDDKHASLSIAEGDDCVVLKCHAGCTYEQIMSALGLKPSDGFVPKDKDEPEQVYQYVDEHGEVLFEVVRFPGKTFRQRQPDGTWGISGIPRVLYHLPEVLEARGKRWIHVVEGEKDADAIRAAGGVATCNMGGAGSWRPEYTETLRGAHVRIVADKDEPGVKHAEFIAEALQDVAAVVEIVQAAKGKDAYDHLRAGLELEDFVPYNPENGLVLTSFSTVKPEDVRWIEGFENQVAYGHLALMTGMPGANKTTWATMLAAKITTLGERAMVITAEDTFAVLKGRLVAHGGDSNLCVGAEMRRNGFDGLILLPEDILELERSIARQKIRLLVLDPIQAHYGREVDSHRDQSIRAALAPLAAVARRNDCAVLMLNHLTKGKERDPYQRAGGSIGLPGIARTCLLMAEKPDDAHGNRRVVVGFKNSYGPKADAYEYELVMAHVEGYEVPPIRLSRLGPVYISAAQLLGGKGEE